VKFFFQVTYLREGKVREVRAVFDDPAKAAPWAQRIYGTNLLSVKAAKGRGVQQALDLELEAPPTEERA
jgi:hypothetical protein